MPPPQPVYLDFRNDFYVFPPTPERIVKFAIHAIGYINAQDVTSEGNDPVSVSVPRTKLYRGTADDNIPRTALAELRAELGKVWPDLAKKPVASTRMCWWVQKSSLRKLGSAKASMSSISRLVGTATQPTAIGSFRTTTSIRLSFSRQATRGMPSR